MLKNGNEEMGFTLIELMIVVAIIGIIAAIAYPSYTQYQLRINRADVQSEMMRVTQKLQSYKAINHTYTSATLVGIGSSAIYPSGTALYDLSLTATAQTWVLTAMPKTGTIQAGNGIICLNSQGQRFWSKGATVCNFSNTSNWDGR